MIRARRRSHPTEIADPGLQGERTYHAWQRTALSFAAAGAMLLQVGADDGRPIFEIPGLFGLATAGTVLVGGVVRYRTAAAAARAERSTAIPIQILLAALASTVLGAGALVATAVSQPPERVVPLPTSADAHDVTSGHPRDPAHRPARRLIAPRPRRAAPTRVQIDPLPRLRLTPSDSGPAAHQPPERQ
jgi:uncharacterized membrane protein YidH (DUF202 family)